MKKRAAAKPARVKLQEDDHAQRQCADEAECDRPQAVALGDAWNRVHIEGGVEAGAGRSGSWIARHVSLGSAGAAGLERPSAACSTTCS